MTDGASMRAIIALLLVSLGVAIGPGSPRAEPIVNLATGSDEIKRASADSAVLLLESIQRVYGAMILLEQGDVESANTLLQEAADLAGSAAAVYEDIRDNYSKDGVKFSGFDILVARYGEAVGRIHQVFEIYRLGIPTDLEGMIGLIADELRGYQAVLDESEFSADGVNMEVVAEIQRAIGRVISIGTTVPYFTRGSTN